MESLCVWQGRGKMYRRRNEPYVILLSAATHHTDRDVYIAGFRDSDSPVRTDCCIFASFAGSMMAEAGEGQFEVAINGTR